MAAVKNGGASSPRGLGIFPACLKYRCCLFNPVSGLRKTTSTVFKKSADPKSSMVKQPLGLCIWSSRQLVFLHSSH